MAYFANATDPRVATFGFTPEIPAMNVYDENFGLDDSCPFLW
jgi:hypothetical protein